ncbi:peptide ABC transporter permease [Sphingomonas gilva]|uniref:Peptide ABC transporter permease n=1 Tax=Sphingomonas gilva TaxID=2305907 RepID=A0A396RRR6_9SPHN|nr:SapC family protein [Sphingomonas gilva]RHW19099.1 peptide ABC transporter permease [Sphingomonas gilva]
MTSTVLLNNVDHHDLRVIPGHGAAFGDNINQVRVFPTEFEELQREYPIFFRRDGEGALAAVALLGLDRDENLFLDEAGWQARYVPATQRRGPFRIGRPADGEPVIHVDLDHPRLSREEGLPLFLPHGGNAPSLEQAAGVLRIIHDGLAVLPAMFAAFEQAGLIEPVAVEIQLSDARRYTLPGLHAVSEERLAALDGQALARLHRDGFLRLAFLAAASLANVHRLIDLKNRRATA